MTRRQIERAAWEHNARGDYFSNIAADSRKSGNAVWAKYFEDCAQEMYAEARAWLALIEKEG